MVFRYDTKSTDIKEKRDKPNFIKSKNFCTKDTMKKNEDRDFPGGPMVKNPPSKAGDTGLIPGWGTKIPHAMGQLRP